MIRRDRAEAGPTLPASPPALVIADHAGVPDAVGGTGAERAAVARKASDARAGGFRVVPLGPLAHAMRRRHPGWADACAL